MEITIAVVASRSCRTTTVAIHAHVAHTSSVLSCVAVAIVDTITRSSRFGSDSRAGACAVAAACRATVAGRRRRVRSGRRRRSTARPLVRVEAMQHSSAFVISGNSIIGVFVCRRKVAEADEFAGGRVDVVHRKIPDDRRCVVEQRGREGEERAREEARAPSFVDA